jgi:signal transduction histidine kinase
VSEEKDFITVCVADEGLGLSEEDIGMLFKPFSRVNKPEYSETSGTGLGLSISKGLIDVHGGRRWAESEGRGKGSTFTFTLPR